MPVDISTCGIDAVYCRYMSRDMKSATMWYVQPAKPQISLRSDQSLCLLLEYIMSVKLLTEHHFEFLSLKGGCTGSSESTLAKFHIV